MRCGIIDRWAVDASVWAITINRAKQKVSFRQLWVTLQVMRFCLIVYVRALIPIAYSTFILFFVVMVRVPSCWVCPWWRSGLDWLHRTVFHSATSSFRSYPCFRLFPFLYTYLGDEKRSISEFGYSEIELVLSIFLKQLWGSNPSNTSSLLFQHLSGPTWRSMKLLSSLLNTIKSNDIPDFSLPTELHAFCVQSFFESGIKQIAEWVVNALLCFGSSYDSTSSARKKEELQLSLDLFADLLSLPWPKPSHFKWSKRKRLSVDRFRKRELTRSL